MSGEGPTAAGLGRARLLIEEQCGLPLDLGRNGITFTKTPTKEFYGIEALFRDGCGNWFSMTEHARS